jgi:hypothetical protein
MRRTAVATAARPEVARLLAQPPQDLDQGLDVSLVDARVGVHPLVETVGRDLRDLPPLGRHLGQLGTTVRRMRAASHVPLVLEPVQQAGDAGRVHLQAVADQRQRQGPTRAEHQHHQHLVAGQRQPEVTERRVRAVQDQLLRTDDRGDHRHAGCGVRPAVTLPLAAGLGDRIEGQRHRRPHLPARRPWGR